MQYSSSVATLHYLVDYRSTCSVGTFVSVGSSSSILSFSLTVNTALIAVAIVSLPTVLEILFSAPVELRVFSTLHLSTRINKQEVCHLFSMLRYEIVEGKKFSKV